MATRQKTISKPYSGYHQNYPGPDLELTQVGPDTPGGEYLRRFWQPIELSSTVKDRPVALKIMGEDLVLFRDLGGRPGLLHAHCAHRGASLEFGKITDRGIQCCYHGWHFAVDGTLLETPVDPGTTVCGRVFQGAYPVVERCGLVFAYMGPPEKKPPFPNFDFFDEPAGHRYLRKTHSPCNWIQTRDNEVDNAHAHFLHTVMAGEQLTDAHQKLAKIYAFEAPLGLLPTQTRRMRENVYVRVNALILPNLARIACIEDGKETNAFDRRGPIVHWAVPVDDENCFIIGWNTIAPNLPDPKHNAYMDREARAGKDPLTHPQLNFLFGQDGSRSYEERQKIPGDWDAWCSQGPIHITANDHLVPHDQGVVLYHKMLKEGIRSVQQGKDPRGLVREEVPIYTYAHNTSIPVAHPGAEEDDKELIDDVERQIIAKTVEGDCDPNYRYERNPISV